MLGTAARTERAYDRMANRYYDPTETISGVRTEITFDHIAGDFTNVEAVVADTLGADMVQVLDDAYDKDGKTVAVFQVDGTAYHEVGPYELETDWDIAPHGLVWDVLNDDDETIGQFTH